MNITSVSRSVSLKVAMAISHCRVMKCRPITPATPLATKNGREKAQRTQGRPFLNIRSGLNSGILKNR
ncbi:MAG: hypothetical protein HQL99_15830 [Magnetococcales bacterium]|nr:hypothetical protein [Magnetococcales bacterium]